MKDLSLQEILTSKETRKIAVKNSFALFFLVYFGHYAKYKSGSFQKEIKDLLQDRDNKFLEIIAFRGSSKSTMSTLAFPIWEVISGNARFPILISDTFGQAKMHIYNLKTELENNEGLVKDWGPFEENEEWTSTGLVLPRYDARISAKSTGQKVRGLRHKQYRPDLFVIDDIENLQMIRTKEQRDKTYQWFIGDVVPAGDVDTRYILIGNLLHSDSIMARIKNEILQGVRNGIVKEFPFFNEDGTPRWSEKFTTPEKVEEEKKKYDHRAWQREFLLKIVPEEGQIIKDEWIKYYDNVPEEASMAVGTGVDLAISKKATADFTAMVSGKLYKVSGEPKAYIMPNPVHDRLSGFETTERGRAISVALGNGSVTPMWVEDVAYQKMQIESMVRAGLPVKGIKVSSDKRARLMTIAAYVENGQVLFPRTGCEDLIAELVGFGIEAHDDLVDSFVYCVQGLMNKVASEPQIWIV